MKIESEELSYRLGRPYRYGSRVTLLSRQVHIDIRLCNLHPTLQGEIGIFHARDSPEVAGIREVPVGLSVSSVALFRMAVSTGTKRIMLARLFR